MEGLFIVIFGIILTVAIMVAISRWVFRVNDIVRLLEEIKAALYRNNK